MAEIPVERKTGIPWWAYVLGLVVLLALIVLLMRGCGTTTTGALDKPDGPARISAQGVGTATGERVTDVNVFGSAVDKKSLEGRDVELQNVSVKRVLSDRVFTVTAGTDEMFVMLDNRLNTGAAEEAIQTRPGQMVNLSGNFQGVPDEQTKEELGRGLNQQEYQQMKGQQIYLHATQARNVK